MPQDIHDLTPGYYKTRLYPRGPYVPVKVWWEGEYENGELVADEVLRCRWWPNMGDKLFEEINPFEEHNYFLKCMFFEDIDKDEFEFMIAMKELG